MKLRSMGVALALLAGSLPVLAQTDLRNPSTGNEYAPRLSDIMTTAQSQHLKLWLAGMAQNWDLATYEIAQLKTSLAQAAMLYSGLPVTNVTTLMTPLQSITDALAGKDARRFGKAFGELTDGCNACHRSIGRSFVLIRVPTDQKIFSNQLFGSKDRR